MNMKHEMALPRSDSLCSEPDEAPPGEKEVEFRERWECISKESSQLLLKQVLCHFQLIFFL